MVPSSSACAVRFMRRSHPLWPAQGPSRPHAGLLDIKRERKGGGSSLWVFPLDYVCSCFSSCAYVPLPRLLCLCRILLFCCRTDPVDVVVAAVYVVVVVVVLGIYYSNDGDVFLKKCVFACFFYI